MTNIPIRFLAPMLSGVLAGCSANYEVVKVEGNLPSVLEEPGIYYTLPKTEVIVGMDFVRVKTTNGPWRDNFSENLNKCLSDPTFTPKKSTKLEIVKYQKIIPFIVPNTVPDTNRRYKLDVDFDAFSSFSHTVELTESGILKATDSKVNNVSAEVALNTVRIVKDIALSFAGGSGVAAAPTDTNKILQNIIKNTGKSNTAKCMEIYLLVQAIKEREAVEEERQKYLQTLTFPVTSEILSNVMSSFDAKDGAVKAKYAKSFEKVSQTIQTVPLRYLGIVTPLDFTEFEEKAVAGELLKISEGAEPGIPATEILVDPGLKIEIEEIFELSASIVPQDKYGSSGLCDKGSSQCAEENLKGYRYRIPVLGAVTLKVSETHGEKTVEKIVAKTLTTIAQFGPIAALPSEVNGLEGAIKLSVYNDSGALKEITVGATPLPSSTVSDFASIGADYVTSKRAAEAAVKKSAEDRQLNTILKENELLEAQKKNKELKTELGLGE